MIKEIQAKTLLSHVKQPDTWFGLKYNMNLYRGCQHRCIYCDSRSLRYGIDHFDSDILVKANAIELLRKELASKRVKGTIGAGSMNDPYMPLEKRLNLTGRALDVIAEFRFPVHILTKSDLVLRDIDALAEISRVFATVSFTITAANDALGKQVEPGAPPVSARFKAIERLSARGINAGIILMPVLPFIEDNAENIAAIVKKARDCGAKYILPSFGMTLRDRQRDYYYRELDRRFPGLRQKYQRAFGDRYGVSANNVAGLKRIFYKLRQQYGIAVRVPCYEPLTAAQLSFF